jgi:hypothetical protein
MYAEHCEVDGEGFDAARSRFGKSSSLLPPPSQACTRETKGLIDGIANDTDTERALERDHFMTAEEAKTFGIVDKIVQRRPKSEIGAGSGTSGATSS